MTTISFDGKMLAADRRITIGNFIRLGTKIYDCGEYVYGCSGIVASYLPIIDWIRNGCDRQKMPSIGSGTNHGMLVRKSDRKIFQISTPGIIFIEYEVAQHAEGSGQPYALAAMACGKTAKEAVLIASMFDCNTGPEIDVYDFGGFEK